MTKSITKVKGKIDYRTSIEEIKNGFLIVRTKEGQDAKGKWIYETEKYFSKTNPLADVEKKLVDNFKE